MTTVTLTVGGCLDVLRDMPDGSVDAVVTDPPYGLAATRPAQVADVLAQWAAGDTEHTPTGRGFMGHEWDAFVPPPAVWAECLRVLKPGGHAVVFAGSRTADLMGVSLRLAGFDIRDTLQWLYGSGMPKSKSALKPAHEPIILARRPFVGSEAATVRAHGTGALNIDGCRIGGGDQPRPFTRDTALGIMNDDGWEPKQTQYVPASGGRWPANVALDDEAAALLDAQAGTRRSGARRAGDYGLMGYMGAGTAPMPEIGASAGGASRFFYVAKASAAERPTADGVRHPTVKPLALMQWLIRLVTPPDGIVLDPFAGSGTTGEAAALEGHDAHLIERAPEYAALIRARIDRAAAHLNERPAA